MSKILLYSEPTTGVTTNGEQHAFYVDENGIPTVKHGSQVIQFGTSGYAFAGSSGSSGINGTNGYSGTSGISGTSGQDGAPGDFGPAGSSGSSGESGSSGINGIDGATGTSGSSGISYGTSGSSGSNGANGLGAKSKAGTISCIDMIYVDGGAMAGFSYIDITFSEAFGNSNYSISTTPVNFYDDYYLEITDKTENGFRLYWTLPDVDKTNLFIDWLAISHGETGVAVAGSSGSSGVSGGGGGGSAVTPQNVTVSYTGQTPYNYYGTDYYQWKTKYFSSNYLDRGTGGGYIDNVWGYIVPFVLKPGESIKKVGGYVNSKITGTAECKLAVFNNDPKGDAPYQKLQENTLTVTCPGYSDLIWMTWDYNFTNTTGAEAQFWFMLLYPIRLNNDFEFSQGYRDIYYWTGPTTVYPQLWSNQFQPFDTTNDTYDDIPDWSYFVSNNNWPTLKAVLNLDRVLPICWQTDMP